MNASKITFLTLILLIFECGCVATKTSSKSKKGKETEESRRPAQENFLSPGSTCPENISGEEAYCQTFTTPALLSPVCINTCPSGYTGPGPAPDCLCTPPQPPPRCTTTSSSGEEHCQIFTKKAGEGNRPIDILWVVDNSGSMREDQAALATNFGSFINGFANIAQNMDFKMQIITTDSSSRRGSDSILNSASLKRDKASFITHFEENIKVGSTGDGIEKGLFYSSQFTQNSSSWMRNDAYLIVIYVSDEEDRTEEIDNDEQGEIRDNAITDKYFKAISGRKSSSQLFKAFAIVCIDSSCGGKNNKNKGERYIKMAELSGGKSYDINASFDNILNDFGKTTAAIASRFLLKYPAVASSIEVYVNGTIAPQSDWTYLLAQNAVRFEQSATPSAGSTIKIVYRIK